MQQWYRDHFYDPEHLKSKRPCSWCGAVWENYSTAPEMNHNKNCHYIAWQEKTFEDKVAAVLVRIQRKVLELPTGDTRNALTEAHIIIQELVNRTK